MYVVYYIVILAVNVNTYKLIHACHLRMHSAIDINDIHVKQYTLFYYRI